MATRGYFPSTGAAPISPTADAAWEDTSLLARLKGVTAKISSAMTTVEFTDNDATNKDVLARQYVFGPFQAVTIAGTIKIQMRASEGDAANNMFLAWGVRVIGADLTVRGTPIAVRRDGTEIPGTTLTNRGDSATPTSTNLLSGDYIVVEVGAGGDPTDMASGAWGKGHDYRVRIGDADASDLPEDSTDTTDKNPWIEFTETLVSSSAGAGAFKRALLGVGV